MGAIVGKIILALVIVLVIIIVVTGYKKAPPDTAFIISGLRKKVIIGKASIKIPFLERMDKLSLKLLTLKSAVNRIDLLLRQRIS